MGIFGFTRGSALLPAHCPASRGLSRPGGWQGAQGWGTALTEPALTSPLRLRLLPLFPGAEEEGLGRGVQYGSRNPKTEPEAGGRKEVQSTLPPDFAYRPHMALCPDPNRTSVTGPFLPLHVPESFSSSQQPLHIYLHVLIFF